MIQCMEILQVIIDSENAFPDRDWAKVPKTSTGMYTKCLSVLRNNGLIAKRDGYYSLTRDLIFALDKVQDRWNELVNVVERGERVRLR